MARDLFTQPLFSPKLLRSRFAPLPIAPAHLALITEWHTELKAGLGQQKEEALVSGFLASFFCDILGYRQIGSTQWSLDRETRAASGKVDAALGQFSHGDQQVIAPFELKGPKTSNLDALMPGRLKSPVQQAWEYANDLPGSQFVLVSNCDEIRLYALGYGRAAYESWRIADLLDPQHYANFVGLLCAAHLTSGQTRQLLKDNALQEREVTQALYTDYKLLRQDLILGLHYLNSQVVFADLVRHAQKLIDRLLFIAFAESRELLPKGSIAHAAKHLDPYNPQPRWINFCALFAAVDKGNPYLKIPPYNGGLFAPDAALNALQVSDRLVEKFTTLAGYDYAQEVSVTVLGRIFEQSISDLEQLSTLGDIAAFKLTANTVTPTPAKKASVDGKRKRDGVVYTPDHITRFIVDKTLMPVIVERFAQVYSCYRNGDAWRKPTKDEKAQAPKSVSVENLSEFSFWKAWERSLTSLRVCDPACGSGAFLVAAFDVLKEAYRQLHLKLRDLAPNELLNVDISHTILKNNLFGVDINAESIEITKLSLWLKTAERDRPLAGLEANFYQGNSLITDPQFDPLAFDWQTQFPEVFAQSSGFDVILGNPPYVRQERFSPLKPFLEQHYSAYHGMADLYVYFYELGLSRLLRSGGRLGYISSGSFFKSSSGEPLRRLLRQHGQLETLVDFGDWQVFEGVTTYPAIVVLQRYQPDDARTATFLQLSTAVPDLSAAFETHKQTLNLAQLAGGAGTPAGQADEWQLEGTEAAALRRKLVEKHPTLQQAVGAPLYGLKTGLNEAFIIDRATRDHLTFADSASQLLLKPFLEGKDIKRWHVHSEDRWLIAIPKGWTRATMDGQAAASTDEAWRWLQARHPHLAAHLIPFAEAAQKRSDQGDYWWELRACAYYDKFEQPKIYYPDICVAPSFALDTQGMFSGNTGYFLPSSENWLVALLNTKALWFVVMGMSTHIRGGYRRMFTQQIETLPVPSASTLQQAELAALAGAAAVAAQGRLATQRGFGRRILDLLPVPAPKGALPSLGDKLESWWLLADFRSFQAEVQKRFKADIALRARPEWEQMFNTERQRVHEFSSRIAENERHIDALVYEMFGLTTSEIALIERTVCR